MNKKGELTSKQLVSIIILIISFIVILIFFFFLNPGSEAAKEACRNSVALRGTELGKSTKIECKTQPVCISAGGNCDYNAKDVATVKVKSKEEVMSALSDLMYDCWWQMGEGKVDYAPRVFGFTENYCHICNTIKFDDKIKSDENLNKIGMKEYYYYLQNKKVSNGEESYLYYLYQVNSMEGVRERILEESKKEGGEGLDIYANSMNFASDSEYALLTGVTKEGYGPAVIAGSIGAAAGITLGVVFPPSAPVAITVLPKIIKQGANMFKYAAAFWFNVAKGGSFGGAVGLYVTNGNIQSMSPVIYPFNSQQMANLNCKAFTSTA